MGHSDSLKNFPYADSKEFEKFLTDEEKAVKKFLEYNAIDSRIFNKYFLNKNEDASNNHSENTSDMNQPKKESIAKIIFKIVDNWCMNNPGPSLAIILGGSAFIFYKMTISALSQAIFKGNLKTSRYFDKHAG